MALAVKSDESTSISVEMSIPDERVSSRAAGLRITAVAARNSIFVLGAQILIKILAFIFNVYVVRTLGAVHFGRYSAVMAYITILSIFSDLGMAPYAMREMSEDPERTGSLLPNVMAMRGVLSLLVIAIAPLSAMAMGEEGDMLLGVTLASVGLLFYAVQGPLEGALTSRERLDYAATYSVVNQLLFWGVGVWLLIRGAGFIGLIVASWVGVAACAVLSGWTLRRLGVGKLRLDVRHWPALVRASLPFGVSSLADALVRRFDTVLIFIILTDAAVGWYNVSYNLILMLLLLAQSISTAIYPSLVRGYAANQEVMGEVVPRAIKYLMAICLPMAMGGTILADRIILTLYGAEFAPSIPVLRLALWALPSTFLLELVGRVAFTLHLERRAAGIDLLNAGITIVLNLALIPYLGLMGAALAFVLGRTIRLGQFMALIGPRRLLGRDWMGLVRVTVAGLLMAFIVYVLRQAPLAISIGIGAVAYVLLLLAVRGIDRAEIRFLSGALLQQR
jgi:O-antigen/teichoic acid export membrane protein